MDAPLLIYAVIENENSVKKANGLLSRRGAFFTRCDGLGIINFQTAGNYPAAVVMIDQRNENYSTMMLSIQIFLVPINKSLSNHSKIPKCYCS